MLTQLAAGEHPPALIVIGAGDGGIFDHIARCLPGANVLALEPSAGAAHAVLARPDVSRRIRDGRLMLLVGPTYTGATDAWRLFEKITGMPPMLVDPAIEQQHTETVARAKLVAAQAALGAMQNNQARRKFAGPYLLNTLTNLPAIVAESNVAALVDAFSGVPAVIVAAGPSLDRNIADLKRLDGRALVIAADTAVRPLLAADIRPHLVVSVDPSDVNARHLNGLPDTSGMWLVAEGSVYPTVLPQFAGRTFMFRVSDHHPWPWLASHDADRGRLQAWGSVLTTAFDLACRLGCNPIVFAGADLAYTDRLLYCRNTTYESDWSQFPTDRARAEFFELAYFPNHPVCGQPDVRGSEVWSAPRFVQFRDWIVARANAAVDRQIVNGTGGGILHGGRIQQEHLGTVLKGLPSLDSGSTVSDRLTAAWRNGNTDAVHGVIRRGLHQVLQRQKKPQDQLQEWADFGRDSVSAAEIVARAEFALRELTNVHRGRPSRWAENVTELMHILELTKQLEAVRRERDEARAARDSALAERDSAIQVARDEAAVAAFLGHYPAWRTHRLRVLMDLWGQENLRGATVLELACGHGDIGAFFLSLGADVTFVDAREEHLAVVRTRYPDATTVLHDANQPLLAPNGGRYDYVIHMGLLYHLRPDAVAGSIANACELGRHVVLDTQVCDSDDSTLVVEMRESGFDQAVDGIGCRPSTAFIERVLNDRGVRWRRHDDPRLNTDLHIYDWKSLNDGRYFDPAAAEKASPVSISEGIRRFYTIEAR